MRIEVPKEFQPEAVSNYPSYCTSEMIEQYVDHNFNDCETDRIYLPVYWTNYYCQNDYGNGNIKSLYKFLDSLDKSKKYWTVIQYDDGIIESPYGLDILVFSAGNPVGIAIPLIPSQYLDVPHTLKGYDLSFIGNINTHPIRRQVVEETGCWKLDGLLSSDYYKTLAQSDFTLCPRGYGVASFRLYEALHCASIPVYVSDVHWLPASKTIDWGKFCVIVKPDELHLIREKMAIHIQDWNYYNEVKGLFTMQGTLEYIEGFLKGEFELRNESCFHSA